MMEKASVGLQGEQAQLNNQGIITLRPRIFLNSPDFQYSMPLSDHIKTMCLDVLFRKYEYGHYNHQM